MIYDENIYKATSSRDEFLMDVGDHSGSSIYINHR